MAKARDPICGMTVETETARYHANVDGQEVYFCSEACRKRFVADRPRP